jgi:hypothetical protein
VHWKLNWLPIGGDSELSLCTVRQYSEQRGAYALFLTDICPD